MIGSFVIRLNLWMETFAESWFIIVRGTLFSNYVDRVIQRMVFIPCKSYAQVSISKFLKHFVSEKHVIDARKVTLVVSSYLLI